MAPHSHSSVWVRSDYEDVISQPMWEVTALCTLAALACFIGFILVTNSQSLCLGHERRKKPHRAYLPKWCRNNSPQRLERAEQRRDGIIEKMRTYLFISHWCTTWIIQFPLRRIVLYTPTCPSPQWPSPSASYLQTSSFDFFQVTIGNTWT